MQLPAICALLSATMTDSPRRPKIGLALGGGGARGLAHIGVLKVLEHEGVRIDAIAGTSMGGIVGAMAAAGMAAAEIEAQARAAVNKITDVLKLVDLSLSQSGVLKGGRLYELMASKLGPATTFADLSIPFAVVATDITTGREVVLCEGGVADAVRATMSVPGVFVPVHIGPYHLVDGGVLNNVPADVVREMGVDYVIAVDVLPNFQQNVPGQAPTVARLHPPILPRPYRGIWNIQLFMISALTEFRLRDAKPEVIIRPDLPIDMDLFIGFDRPDVAIAAGVQAATAALPQIRALLPA